MSIIDDFYRKREIINLFQAWQPQVLTVVVNGDKDVVEVGFRSGLKERLTKDEIHHLLVKIQEDLVPLCQESGDISRGLTKKLHEKLGDLKDQIRKDFDLKEVK